MLSDPPFLSLLHPRSLSILFSPLVLLRRGAERAARWVTREGQPAVFSDQDCMFIHSALRGSSPSTSTQTISRGLCLGSKPTEPSGCFLACERAIRNTHYTTAMLKPAAATTNIYSLAPVIPDGKAAPCTGDVHTASQLWQAGQLRSCSSVDVPALQLGPKHKGELTATSPALTAFKLCRGDKQSPRGSVWATWVCVADMRLLWRRMQFFTQLRERETKWAAGRSWGVHVWKPLATGTYV